MASGDAIKPKEPPRCAGCPFKRTVGAKGNPKAPFVIVGESPGTEELRKGIPFAGPSGKILHTYIPEDHAYILNAFQCFPGKSNSKEKKEEKLYVAANTCRERLLKEITAHPRRIILTLGRWAAGTLLGDLDIKITRARGKLYKSPYAELGVFTAIHPAALMRGTGSFRQWREDILYAYEMSQGANPKEYEPCKFTWYKETPEDFKRVDRIVRQLRRANKGKVMTCDTETTGLQPSFDYPITIGITGDDEHVHAFQIEHLQQLKPLFEDPQIKWNWHNGKYDVQLLRGEGIQARVDEDTMLMSYAMDETGGIHDLETISNDVLGAPDYKYMIDPYVSKKEKDEWGYYPVWLRAPGVLMEYMSLDVGNTHRVFKKYRARVKADPITEKLYTRTLIPASEMLAKVESRGFYVDRHRIAENGAKLVDEQQALTAKLQDLAGTPFNPNSPTQLAVILFDRMGLPHKKGDRSTADGVLDELPQTPFVKAMRRYRKVAKAEGTYVRGMLKHIQADGRIHPTFKIHGTRTGRLSSADPNMQNIPRDPMYKGMFIAAPGHILVEGDLNQAELRSLACVSGDPVMCEIYRGDTESMHDVTARALFGPVYDEDQRVRAKSVNFGIIYGRTAYTIAQEFDLENAEGQRWIDAWANRFKDAWKFIAMCRRAPLRSQTLTTTFGRRKRVGIVTRDNINALQNEASNFPHQSIASDITLHAAIKVQPKLEKLNAYIVNLVHDNIVAECPDNKDLAMEVGYLIKEAMETTAPEWGLTRVPFKADMKWGYRWGSNEKLKV